MHSETDARRERESRRGRKDQGEVLCRAPGTGRCGADGMPRDQARSERRQVRKSWSNKNGSTSSVGRSRVESGVPIKRCLRGNETDLWAAEKRIRD